MTPDAPLSRTDTASATRSAVEALWREAGLPATELASLHLPGDGPVLPSSFAVATAAQASLGAAALAAASWRAAVDTMPSRPAESDAFGVDGPSGRASPPGLARVEVDRIGASLGCTSRFLLDGVEPSMWDALSGLYPCGAQIGRPGWVRLHANFAHHRDRALALLGLRPPNDAGGGPGAPPPGELGPDPAASKEAIASALQHWDAVDFETAAAEAGAVVSALRDVDAWDAHPAGIAAAREPLVALRRLGDAPPRSSSFVPGLAATGDPDRAAPLHGLRVLDLTRILAGPVAARLLAQWGADVLMVNAPQLPNIGAIADLSRGKRSALLDLDHPGDAERLRALAASGHVFLQAYRPGALRARGFSPEALAAAAPGIVCVSLAAWGFAGPWAGRRGFDSLVQTAAGFNLAEAAAAGQATPRALPVQILDHAAGHLLAFGTLAALRRQALEGGSWEVRVSLAGTAHWLRSLGQDAGGLRAVAPPLEPWLESEASAWGRLDAPRPVACFDGRRARSALPSVRPGHHPPAWA